MDCSTNIIDGIVNTSNDTLGGDYKNANVCKVYSKIFKVGKVKKLIFKLLKKLTSETQKCILFSTHDIDLAIQLSDEIIVMTPEKVVQDTPQALIKNLAFDDLFKDENIYFDVEKAKFIFKDF